MVCLKVVCIMPRNPSGSAIVRRAAYRIQLADALLLVCRKIRRLQTSAEARAACDDVARELRALSARLKRRGRINQAVEDGSGPVQEVAQTSPPAPPSAGRHPRCRTK
jgi:hypothetical protein